MHEIGQNSEASAFFARIQGRVQGVGFRYSACHEARIRGLRGWVRNTPGGDVEVWAEGPSEKLESFFQWLRQGPPAARVESIDRGSRPPTGCYRTFSYE